MKTIDEINREKNAKFKKVARVDESPFRKMKIFNLILICFNIIFIIAICCLIYLLIKRKNKNIMEEKTEHIIDQNSISAVYSIKSGQKIKLFNPDKIGLKEDDYIIEINEKNNNLRNLKSLNTENGFYIPNESGNLGIKIKFKSIISNFNEFFKDNNELIKVDLSNFEMKNIKSMNSSFSGCSNLNEVNLEGINTNNFLDMSYTFEKCKNLKNINLSPIKSDNIRNTKGIFSECDNLETVNISSFEIVNDNMFEGIKSRPNIIANQKISATISNIFYNMFNININITIVENKNHIENSKQCSLGENEKCKECNYAIPENCLTCNKGFYLPFNEKENKICLPCNKIKNCSTCFGDKYYIACSSCESSFYLENNECKKIQKLKKCVTGEKEKCKECKDDEDLINQCKICNEGYYLEENSNKTECVSCNKIEDCMECNEDNNKLICNKCREGYELINNSCIEKNCEIGANEKCSSCKLVKDKKKECYTCNEGYFLKENSTICSKCTINNCKKCSFINNKEICNECLDTFIAKTEENELIKSCECEYGYKLTDGFCKKIKNCNKIEDCMECNEENNKLICNRCREGYELINNSCIEKNCEIGANEKCSSCKLVKDKKKECYTCNEGYFLKENSTICSKCTINNCKKCSFINNKEICNECLDTFIAKTEENELIKSCECEYGYSIINELCTKPGNWIKVLMDVDYSWNNGYADIFDNIDSNIKSDEIDVYINGTYAQVSVDRYISYKFDKGGIYSLEINIKKQLTTMSWLFNSDFIYSVYFLPGFDSSKVTSLEYMFVSSNIESIDMKYLDLSNVKNIKFFIYENSSVKRYEKLNEYIVDISSFDTSQITDCSGMFHDISQDVIIKISNKFTKCREQIPIVNKVINVDEIECQKFENCEKCVGTKKTLKCGKCKIGYKLNLYNICFKPKCNLGENEKCSDCKSENGKENECSSCNEGYHLPINAYNLTSCKKCLVDGCKSCDRVNGKCISCLDNYEPLMDNGEVIKCELMCQLGNGDKCLACNKQIKNKCGSCNPGYKLLKSGICKKIENSFIASYNVNSLNNPIYLMNLKGNNIKLSNIIVYLNNEIISPYIICENRMAEIYYENCYVSYKFNNLGINNVKVIINQTLTRMQNLFYYSSDLVNISFSETFDTSNVQCMDYLFGSCTSLLSINISSFNTSLVSSKWNMYYNCPKLNSIIQ